MDDRRLEDVRMPMRTPDQQTNQSEVARLMLQIQTEYEAAQRGLSGLAQGTAEHEFITARIENIGRCGEQLKHVVGDPAEGTRLLIAALDGVQQGGSTGDEGREP